MSRVKQTFGAELCLELLVCDLKVADALRLKIGTVELIRSVSRIDRNASECGNAHAAFGAKAEL